MPIEHAPVDAGDVIEGRPSQGAHTLDVHNGVEVGVWEITTGTVQDTEIEEAFVVLSGRGRIEFADNSSLDLHAGIVVRLQAGDRTRWIVHETLRKLYILLPDSSKEATS